MFDHSKKGERGQGGGWARGRGQTRGKGKNRKLKMIAQRRKRRQWAMSVSGGSRTDKKMIAEKDISFHGEGCGPLQDDFAACSSPVEYFLTCLSQEIVGNIVTRSNLYQYVTWR